MLTPPRTPCLAGIRVFYGSGRTEHRQREQPELGQEAEQSELAHSDNPAAVRRHQISTCFFIENAISSPSPPAEHQPLGCALQKRSLLIEPRSQGGRSVHAHRSGHLNHGRGWNNIHYTSHRIDQREIQQAPLLRVICIAGRAHRTKGTNNAPNMRAPMLLHRTSITLR